MFTPSNYDIICSLFPRLIGIVYFFALFPLLFQIKGLIGTKGILPAQRYLALLRSRLGRNRYWRIPTLFWIDASDASLVGATAFGTLSAVLLAWGLAPWIFLPILIIIHLSIINVGQDFLGFGWEGFLLEISCNAFLLSLVNQPNLFVWISLNLLLFRFHFEAGISKIQSGDTNWRNLTAVYYHFQTQPIPNALGWWFHKLPMGFHRFSCAAMFFIELIVPFAVLGDGWVRLAGFFLLASLQVFIAISGNYSYLSLMTVVLCTLLISDNFLEPIFGPAPSLPPSSLGMEAIVSTAAILLIALQLAQLASHFFVWPKIRDLLYRIYSYHFANRYGIFSIMTTTRYEIVIEGSGDEEEWKEYLFYFKPSETERRPRQVAPFHPRLDWQAWFLPFVAYEESVWFQNFLYRLLQGEPAVLRLMRHNPFPTSPPKYIRAKLYVYEYSPRGSDQWWVRTELGLYSPVVTS